MLNDAGSACEYLHNITLVVDHSITAHQQSHILSVSEVEDGLAQLHGAHPCRLQRYTHTVKRGAIKVSWVSICNGPACQFCKTAFGYKAAVKEPMSRFAKTPCMWQKPESLS